MLGDPVPDPNIGRRIGPATGLIINDLQGFERTGYGFIDQDDGWHVGGEIVHQPNVAREP